MNMIKMNYLSAILLILAMISCKGQTGNEPGTAELPDEEVQSGMPERSAVGTDVTPLHLTKADFLQLVMDYEKNPDVWNFAGEKPCLIDFYADWCAPCRITSPILEELAKQYAGRINIYKIDIEKERELAAVFGVQSIPTFLFCPVEGNPTISSGIAGSPEATRSMFIQQIEELLLKNPKEAL
jgi:thioredoxin